ncbi:MAG: hypothetical protein U1F98_15525 [Verrucomicrobiota bacterium]
MKFASYTSTPGLERFPEAERHRVYQSMYRQLMEQDAEFRGRVGRYKVFIVVLSIVFCLLEAWPILMISRGAGSWPVAVAMIAVSSGAYAAYVLLAARQIQQFQNDRIGKALQEHPPA